MATGLSPQERSRPLRPPQFTLRTLLVGMAVVSIALWLVTLIGLVASLLLGLFMLLAAAHVVGNALGTSLRDASPGIRHVAGTRIGHEPPMPRTLGPQQPSQRMTERTRVLPAARAAVIAGAMLGSLVVGGLVVYGSWAAISWGAAMLALASAGVLGGLAGFMAASFLMVFRRALSEAQQGERSDPSRSHDA